MVSNNNSFEKKVDYIYVKLKVKIQPLIYEILYTCY